MLSRGFSSAEQLGFQKAMKKGVLLINLGTPDTPDVRAVRRFLAEFLSDKRVIDLPAYLRYPLVYAGILPFRAKKTCKNYQTIWTKNGSPLLFHSINLEKKLQAQLGSDWIVSFGMRYGNPSLEDALSSLESCEQIIILPLFPQYSSAATGSAMEKVMGLLGKKGTIPSFKIMADFHAADSFIDAQAALIHPHIENIDYLLFSYHGIPERQLKDSACYPEQCYATSEALAKKLALPKEKYGSSFQSRLGKAAWIKPYTDVFLQELAEKGIKNLAVACPSFVADCLETLEEIDISLRSQWHTLTQGKFILIPCVNSSDLWVEGLAKMMQSA